MKTDGYHTVYSFLFMVLKSYSSELLQLKYVFQVYVKYIVDQEILVTKKHNKNLVKSLIISITLWTHDIFWDGYCTV